MNAGDDPRTTLARDGLAARWLEGQSPAAAYRDTEACTLAAGSAAIRQAPHPDSEQVDQLLFGETFAVLRREAGWALGQAARDGYVGWVEAAVLHPGAARPTHRVRAVRSWAFAGPHFKTRALFALPLNALLAVEAVEAGFARAAGAGWVFAGHLDPIGVFETDPAAVAERFVGVPYLWGARDGIGLDCSGLVQQALTACGLACPRDSDQQASLGRPVQRDDLRRSDLVCWRGHIGMMLDGERLAHASSLDMAVTIEALEAAIERKRALGGGEPTGFRRVV